MVKDSPTLRVLVVEDEMLIRWSIAETLANDGYEVVEADSAAAAIRALSDEDTPIDAVVLDFRLPDSHDLSLLSQVRTMAPGTPVIMMTAFGSPEVFRDARALGVFDIMNKPFEMHALEANLRKACARPA